MGTPEFAVAIIRELARTHELTVAVTRPDAVSGRGSEALPSPVKRAALDLGIPVLEASSLRSAEVVDRLREEAPDVICVAAFGLLLPPEVLAIPPHGCINVHASLLPRHRGAAPILRAILEGDEVTGVSIMRMEEGLDTGPVSATVEVPVDRLDATALTGVLADAGAALLLEVLERLPSGTVDWIAQDDSRATWAERVSKADVALHPGLTAGEADARIRASGDSAPARLVIAGRGVRAVAARPVSAVVPAGATAVTGDGLVLGFRSGSLGIDLLIPDGGPAMSGAAFARGVRDPAPSWDHA